MSPRIKFSLNAEVPIPKDSFHKQTTDPFSAMQMVTIICIGDVAGRGFQ